MNHRSSLALIVAAILALTGCAGFGSPKLQPLTNEMINTHKGDFDGLWGAWLEPQLTVQLNKQEFGWDFPFGAMPLQYSDSTASALMEDIGRFCKASGGTFAVAKYTAYGPSEVGTCSSPTSGVLAKVGVSPTFGRESVGQVLISLSDSPRIRADRAGEYGKLAHPGDLGEQELKTLIAKYSTNDPQNLIPAAQQRAAELEKQRIAAYNEWAQKQAKQNAARVAMLNATLERNRADRRRRQENRKVGDQVCVEHDATIKVDTGYEVLGQEQYRTIKGSNHIVGFVEGVSGKRIQIRISGINFTGDNGIRQSLDSMTNFNGGSTLKIGNVIWDSRYNWDGC